jgi:hypothetical protein
VRQGGRQVIMTPGGDPLCFCNHPSLLHAVCCSTLHVAIISNYVEQGLLSVCIHVGRVDRQHCSTVCQQTLSWRPMHSSQRLGGTSTYLEAGGPPCEAVSCEEAHALAELLSKGCLLRKLTKLQQHTVSSIPKI